MREAIHIGHLVEVNALFPSCTRKAIDDILSKWLECLAKDRTAELRRWAVLAEDLRSRESEIQLEMSDRRQTVVKKKRIVDAARQD